jgi:hypothetical protein
VADLQKLQVFAQTHFLGLTNPLEHKDVVKLAEYWFPDTRFFEKEKFYPISLDETFSMVEDLFAGLPATAQEASRVNKFVREGANTATLRAFDPPVVHVPDGFVVQPGQVFRPVVRVLNEGSSAIEALADLDAGPTAVVTPVVTHGASFTRSNQFFGATTTFAGGAEAAPGDPFVPRATGPDGPRITVMASLLNLLELLKYELVVSEAEDYPPDAMRGAFDIARSLVGPATNPPLPLPFATLRQFLLEMIASVESGGDEPPPPFGFRLDRKAWDAVTRFVFLEYDFFYAFNDFNRHESGLFTNEHEGDNEGCCLVFERNVLNIAATVDDSDALLRAVPHSIITSVHEENQNADLFKFIAPPVNVSEDRLARDDVPFVVYAAAGSHATYLTTGTHDVVDFQDYTAFIQENPAVLLFPGPLVVVLIVLAIIEHFTDTEDETSDDGVRIGPEEVVGEHPTAIPRRLIVMPMSADNHIYMPGNDDLLRLRAFAGKWGAHDGLLDRSPAFKPKTGRYFRKLISQL